MRAPRPTELQPLLALSAHVGRDPLLTQASAGNTSMKINGRLWIKASGKRLADALQDDIFLPVELSAARNCVRQRRAIVAAATNSSGEKLDPSVETAMHAVLPQRVIVHLHSVNMLVRAVRLDAEEHLGTLLQGISWAWIPYVSSGLPLARQIERVFSCSAPCDVLVLGNHGLVVCGDDCEAVEDLLNQVELRIAAIPRRAPQFDSGFLARLVDGSKWQVPDHTRLHCLATDEFSRHILANGSLYPCHALYLGGPIPWRSFYSGLYSEAVRHPEHGARSRPFLILRDKGVLLSDTITRTELETLVGLAEIVQRLDVRAPIRYLTRAELKQITSDNVYRARGTPDHVALLA